MPNTTVLTNNQYYQDIATAIRAKNGSSTQYKPREMASAIDSLVVSGQAVTLQNKTVNPSTTSITVIKDAGYTGLGTVTVNAIQTETKTVTENGTVTPTSGKFFSQVTVSVQTGTAINNQNTTVTPNTTTQTISAEEGYTGLGTVTVEPIPSAYIIPSGTKTITSNGSTDVTTFATVSVNVQPNLQGKSINPSETAQTVSADSGYDGLSTVTINAISSTYVGSGIATKSSADLTASGATVTAPAGYYATAATKTITSATQATPSISIDSNGKITATSTQAAGYVAAGTKTASAQMTTKAGTTITPSTASQTAVAKNVYTLGTVTVAPVPTETATLTSNGIHNATSGKFWSSVTVSIPSDINNQNKTITSSTVTQTISADSGYSGLGTVTINAIATATQATPAVTINTANGLVSATATQPEGYVASGTKTGTLQLSTQAGTTITPKSTAQTAVAANKYTLGTITVAAVPTETATLTSNGTHNATSGKFWSSVTVAVPSDINNQNKTVTSSTVTQTVSADSGYSGLGTVTVNAIATAAQAVPTISVNASGLISATATQGAGYVSAGTKTTTSQLSVQSGTTITPTENKQTVVASGKYTTGTITVAAIPSDYVGSGIATKSSADLTVTGSTIIAPAGYYASSATATVSGATQATPAITVSTDGKITATVTQAAGYVSAGTKTATSQLSVQSATTITPGASSQTAVASGKYTTGAVTVAAVPTDTDNTFTTNGTKTPAAGKYFSSVIIDVPVGSTINNQDKTVTSSTVTQTLSADSGYTGLGTVTINAIATAVQATPAITVSTDGKITATATQAAGYVAAGTKTATQQLSVQSGTTITPTTASQTAVASGKYTTGTITVAAIQTETKTATQNGDVTPSTGKYLTKVTVSIPSDINNEGAKTITPSTATQTITPGTGYSGLSKVTVNPIPSNYITTSDATATASHIFAGDTAYVNGSKVTGTMTNRADWSATLDQTTTSVTIPEGYHNGSGTVSHATVDIPDPTISMVNSTGVITASGTWTRGFTTDNSYTKTYTLTTQAGTTITPSETAQTAVAQYRWTTGTVTVAAISSTYVGSGITTRTSLSTNANTVTALAGYYPNAVTYTVPAMTVPTSTSASGTGTRKITVVPSPTTTQYINLPTGYNASTAYFQINTITGGSVTAPSTVSGTAATLSTGNGTLTLSKVISITPVVTTTGYVSAGTAGNATVTLTANVTTKTATTITPGTATTTIAAGTYLTGAQTIAGDADLTAGNIKANVNIFGVNGNFTADATAGADDIAKNATAYVNGSKITGTLVVNAYYTGPNAPSASLGIDGDIYLQE